jgi:hypothetical protein
MPRQLKIARRGSLAALTGALAALVLTASASAFTGEFAKFNYCPTTTPGVFKCLYSVTTGGKIILGKKETTITNPVTLQGGYGEGRTAKFYGATNGITLSKAKQTIPGGLLGILPPEKSPPLVALLSKFFLEGPLNTVEAVLELAKPASEIEISEYNVLLEEGLALKLPVKVHLENVFLGKSCYVGSEKSPIIWDLTAGKTSPLGPNTSITGSSGTAELKEEDEIAQLNGNELVENAWTAPEASGCGGILSFLVDPVLDTVLGLPAKDGANTAILKNTIDIGSAEGISEH